MPACCCSWSTRPDPTFREQYAVTREVVGEIGAMQAPSRLILNKVDRLDEEQRAELQREFPDAIQISALNKDDVARLHATIVAFFEPGAGRGGAADPVAATRAGRPASTAKAQVLSEKHEEAGTRLRVRIEPDTLKRVRGALGPGAERCARRSPGAGAARYPKRTTEAESLWADRMG